MRNRSLILAVFCFLTYHCAADDASLLILGDSLSSGYGMSSDHAWPALLEKRLKKGRFPYVVINASISGDTTLAGLSRLPNLLERWQPEIVILELGGNDGLRGLPPATIKANFEKIIELLLENQATALLVGIRLPPNYGKKYNLRFGQIYSELAAKYELEYLPFLLEDVALEKGLMQADGIHPTAAAQVIVLHNVWQLLAPMLNR